MSETAIWLAKKKLAFLLIDDVIKPVQFKSRKAISHCHWQYNVCYLDGTLVNILKKNTLFLYNQSRTFPNWSRSTHTKSVYFFILSTDLDLELIGRYTKGEWAFTLMDLDLYKHDCGLYNVDLVRFLQLVFPLT